MPLHLSASSYQFNTPQPGEAHELLTSLPANQANLIFFDPQYEKVSQVLKKDYPLRYQSDYEIGGLLKEIERVLKPSSFCLLWVNKTILGTDRVLNWLLRVPNLKIVDLLVWYKQNTLGLGSWLRSQAEFVFLLQKHPTNSKLFTNRSFGNVWGENQLAVPKRKHPHQKPKQLIKALIEATTQKGDLIIDPCAGSFVVLEVCRELKREFIGCEVNYFQIREYLQPKKTCHKCQQVYQDNKALV